MGSLNNFVDTISNEYNLGAPYDAPPSEAPTPYGGYSDLTDSQEIALIILQICSGVLSMIGSSVIVYKIFRTLSKHQKTTPNDRIILGLSCCDIVASVTYIIGPFMLPRDTSQVVWALGGDGSCQVLGFLMQISCLWSLWYNCMLSYYYLLTVRFKVSRKVMRQKFEPWMHLSGIIFFPITAITGYFANWYGEQGLTMTCWVRDVPTGCDADGIMCTGDATNLVSYIYGAIPTVVTFLSLVVNNIIIYVFVRRTLVVPKPKTPSLRGGFPANDIETDDASNSDHQSDSAEPAQSDVQHEEHLNRILFRQRLTREAATQGFLYVTSFLLTASPLFILQVLDGSFGFDKENQESLYPLLVLNSLLLPLQGFFNVFIYVKPTYERFRIRNPEQPRWITLKQALFDPKVPKIASIVGTTIGRNQSFRRNSNLRNSAGVRLNNSSNSSGHDDRSSSLPKVSLGSRFEMSLGNIVEEDDDRSVAESMTSSEPIVVVRPKSELD